MTTPLEISRPDDIGPALREVRLSEEITQSALAQIAGVGRQWLNSFEMGERSFAPFDMVLRVITALGVPVLLTRPAQPRAVADDAAPVDLDFLLREYDQ